MKSIILSIHSRHAEKIYSGEKQYEFRKSAPLKTDSMYLYEVKPVGLITGHVEGVGGAYCMLLEDLWKLTEDYAGITFEEFTKYFEGRNSGYAFELPKVVKYDTPLPLSHFNLNRAPQSWCYTK